MQRGRYDEKGLPSTPHRPECGQPASFQMALKVENAVMCIGIKFCRFARIFQRICLYFYANDELTENLENIFIFKVIER